MKTFYVRRLEKSLIHRQVDYTINANSQSEALTKLEEMKYSEREAGDEIQEDDWKPLQILEIVGE